MNQSQEMLYRLNPMLRIAVDYDEHSGVDATTYRVRDVVDRFGWDTNEYVWPWRFAGLELDRLVRECP